MLSSFEPYEVTKKLPVFVATLPRDESLIDLIKDHKRLYPEGFYSNVKSQWRSDWFTHLKDPRFAPLVKHFESACNFISKEHFKADCNLSCGNMWIAEYEKGDWTKDNDHFPDVMSCVYFVDVDDNCAPLIFEGGQSEIKPENNKLVIFPALVRHEVPPTDGHRLVIAMNFRLDSTYIPNIQHKNGFSSWA